MLGLLRLWGPITLCVDLWLGWGLKQSCSPCEELFNGMSHATCTQGNWVDSRLLVVRSQIANLTPGLFWGHNLCVSDAQMGHASPLYVPRAFSNDIKNSPIQWSLTPAIILWRFNSPSGFQFPTLERTWECECSFSHTLLHSQPLGNMKCDFWASLLVRTHASPCLGRELKVRVATMWVLQWM
jgi:hypothetical protein